MMPLNAPSFPLPQVFFSWDNPLLNLKLPIVHRLWYSYAAWAPFTNTITAPSRSA